MSGLISFFYSCLTPPQVSKNDDTQRRRQDIAGSNYDISLDTIIGIDSPVVNATNMNLSQPVTANVNANEKESADQLTQDHHYSLSVKKDNVDQSSSLQVKVHNLDPNSLHNKVDNADQSNSLHTKEDTMEKSSFLHTTAKMASTNNSTTDPEELEQQIEISELEFFMARRMLKDFESDSESMDSDSHHSESSSNDERSKLQSKSLHQPTTINAIRGRDDNTNGNEYSQYSDAMMDIPVTQPYDTPASLQDSEYHQASENIDSMLQTQPTTTVKDIMQDVENKGKNDATPDDPFSPLQTQLDPIPTLLQGRSPAVTNIANEFKSEIPDTLPQTRKRNKIPHIDDTTQKVTSIHDLNLQSNTLTLELAQVRLIWSFQKTKRLRPRIRKSRNVSGKGEGDSAQPRRRDLGPLAHGFSSVLSMELMELEDPRSIIAEDERSKIVRQTVIRAFGNAGSAVAPTTTLGNVETKPKERRIRLFLYNNYAIQMCHLLEELKLGNPKRSKDPKMKKKVLQDLFVVSLRNIPAQCIFPLYNFPMEEHTSGLLNNNYGRLSRYCICIGGKSKIQIDKNSNWFADSPGLEIRVLKLVRHCENTGHLTMVTNFTGEEEEYLITRSNGKGKNTPALVDSSGMAERYTKIFKKGQSKMGKEIQEEVQDDISSVSSDEFNPNSPCKKRKAPSTVYHTLAELKEIIKSNPQRYSNRARSNAEHDKIVNVFGAVHDICHPKFTTRKQWMMRITLIDDSLPAELTKQTLDASTTAQSVDDVATKEAKKQIAVATLLIFVVKYDEFPHVFRAGDILRIHRVKVQEWSGDLQLVSLRMSSFVVCRPVTAIYQQYLGEMNSSRQTVPSNNSNHWQVHNMKKSPLDFSRTNELWRWAQARLANYSTTNEKFYTNISKIIVSGKEHAHGDLTVMITNIIPMQHGQRPDLPKGILRVWDGSGRPISEKQPIPSLGSDRFSDPPSKALSSIANIISMVPFDDIDAAFEPPKRLCGRVINIAIWEDSCWNFLIGAKMYVKVGNFVRLRNIRRNFSPLATGNEEILGK